jgi:formylglycine-generating enzyme required for sulfatase activity
LKDIRAHHLLLIVDACFSGAMFKDASSPYTQASELYKRPSRRVLTSGLDTRVSDGQPGERNSPFAAALLQVLGEEGSSERALSQVLPDLRKQLRRPDQVPQFRPLDLPGDGLGEFVFQRSSSEAADYEAAQKTDSPAGWRAFLTRYPQTARRAEIEARIGVLEEEGAWQQAERENSVRAYSLYRRTYFRGKHADEALARIERLEEEADWAQARDSKTVAGLEKYLGKYPAGRYVKEAEAAIDQLLDPPKPPPVKPVPARPEPPPKMPAPVPEPKRLVPAVETQVKPPAAQPPWGSWMPFIAGGGLLLVVFVIYKLALGPADNPSQSGAAQPKGASVAQAAVPEEQPFQEPQMIRIPGGTFQMGSEEGGSDEEPVHTVTLSDFYLGETEVTQAQWRALMGSNPSYFKDCDQCPVEQVSWDDIQTYIRRLNAKTGKTYRLPTEAEWEYAAGGGSGSRTKWAGTNSESSLGSYAWYGANSGSKTPLVKQKQPNALGLFDMSGNVLEWCQDVYHNSYTGAPTDGSAWESPAGSDRVRRGGGWGNFPADCRVADRSYSSPGYRNNYLGFRLARTP